MKLHFGAQEEISTSEMNLPCKLPVSPDLLSKNGLLLLSRPKCLSVCGAWNGQQVTKIIRTHSGQSRQGFEFIWSSVLMRQSAAQRRRTDGSVERHRHPRAPLWPFHRYYFITHLLRATTF